MTTTMSSRAQTPERMPVEAFAPGALPAGSPLYEATKRALDAAGAALGLVCCSPLFLALAIAIKAGDGGPVIYRRRVVGRHGVEFDAFKFRTMVPDADQRLQASPALLQAFMRNHKLERDPRVTPVGRWLRRTSLDELPQLVNVLRGQMSLVGPRMIHPSEVDRFGAFARTRQLVKPGLTGLWQVSGRANLSYEARIAIDADYLRRRGLLLDLQILLRTVGAVLEGRGAK